MSKVNFIWPSKFIGVRVRAFVLVFLISLPLLAWGARVMLDLRYENVASRFLIFPLLIYYFYAFLFDKHIHSPMGMVEFSCHNEGKQWVRFCFFVIFLLIFALLI
ncbi:hypothetical protein L861_22205 [Litchfieldella anticariensis FP35 = DSM 16096]|uniref:Uncharacterized protein n=1 Tax=Litchfieldella anticariensis (strain DSM 16096 / CECT 5854 / CIP 108499 / LMG 22089 / FP35) TaxID=1121939 RepID=S2KM74_LITA3|nr:hypothetical protein L861_22205 [Halomonas anticariensis FP35 = DSM 16096]